ncbi:PRC-barrel domain containing protein [Halorussus limi]|uniref:PRC-barrel domain containing protein n=1 Tax=Halorussus limi TaxID=2938695 RepID=A0A8U0HSI3_9EURY|nr:PRC-barrel domain containing protein [Halorussus limi]UPV74072.1 PRC-barrel domain containing protein [Halorussus limi]
MNQPLSEDDEGKRVVGPDGEEIGTVEKVDAGVAHVDPKSSVSEAVKERLDWGDQGDYTFQETHVESVTADEIVLGEDGQKREAGER